MASSSAINGIETNSKLNKLLEEYNSKFSLGAGVIQGFSEAGMLSGLVTSSFLMLLFLSSVRYGIVSGLTLGPTFIVIAIIILLSLIASYKFGNWWFAHRLPKWMNELQKEAVSCYRTITPDGAFTLLAALKYAQEQYVHLKFVDLVAVVAVRHLVSMGERENNRRALQSKVSKMVKEIEQLSDNAKEVARLVGDEKCMDGFLSSLAVASGQITKYK